MPFRAELNEGPESKGSASQHGDTLSFPPTFQRSETPRFSSSAAKVPSLMPSSGIRTSEDDVQEGRPSGVLSTHSTRDGTSPSARPSGESERKAGDIIADRYVLVRVIAQGGMGVVWRAYDREHDQHVAVKLVAPRLFIAEDAAERLCAEAKLLMLIDSPHVARILYAGTMLDGGPYMVTELLQGVTLQQVLEGHTSVPIHQAVEWICQAASGLADVHQVGLVHDDLKPSNLFLAEASGEQSSVKLLDFGIARILSDPSALSARGDVFGNPCYMAPERIAGSWYADHRADIWSLGVVLYELVTTRRPFDGETLNDVCTAVMAAAPPPMRELRPEVNPELEETVRRCLQPRPEHRYSNARLLLLDLERSLASLPVAENREAQPNLEAEHPSIQQSESAVVLMSTVAQQLDSVAGVAMRSNSPVAEVAPFTRLDSVAEVAPFTQSDFSSMDQTVVPAHQDTAASVRTAKLRSIVQAPSLQFPRVGQQRAPASVTQQLTDAEAPPIRRRRRRPAVIAYALAISFVSVVGIVAAARSLRSDRSSGQAAEQPAAEQPAAEQPAVEQRSSVTAPPPVEISPDAKPQERGETTEGAPTPPVNARTVIVLESPTKDASAAPNIRPPTAPNIRPPTPNPKLSAWRPEAESGSKVSRMDTSPPQGIPLREVYINARGELTDAKGKPLPMPAPQK